MIKVGTKVLTVESPNAPDDWGPGVSRVFGIEGIVIGHHDSHGMCYEVAHFMSGSSHRPSWIGHYDPSELKTALPTIIPIDQDLLDQVVIECRKGTNGDPGIMDELASRLALMSKVDVASVVSRLHMTLAYSGCDKTLHPFMAGGLMMCLHKAMNDDSPLPKPIAPPGRTLEFD